MHILRVYTMCMWSHVPALPLQNCFYTYDKYTSSAKDSTMHSVMYAEPNDTKVRYTYSSGSIRLLKYCTVYSAKIHLVLLYWSKCVKTLKCVHQCMNEDVLFQILDT